MRKRMQDTRGGGHWSISTKRIRMADARRNTRPPGSMRAGGNSSGPKDTCELRPGGEDLWSRTPRGLRRWTGGARGHRQGLRARPQDHSRPLPQHRKDLGSEDEQGMRRRLRRRSRRLKDVGLQLGGCRRLQRTELLTACAGSSLQCIGRIPIWLQDLLCTSISRGGVR